MAIIRNRKAATSSATNEAWRASAFLNLYLNGKTNVKLGAIPLRESNASESKLLAWIGDDAAKAAGLKDKFILSYNATGKEDSGLDFLDDYKSDAEIDNGIIGYINISLPTATGTARLSSVALKEGTVLHEKLALWIGDNNNIAILKDKMSVVYQSAISKGADFILD